VPHQCIHRKDSAVPQTGTHSVAGTSIDVGPETKIDFVEHGE
jgi:hypothetical protein